MSLIRLSSMLLAVLGLSSCDKIKDVAQGVSSSVGGKLEERLSDATDQPEVSPLMGWVDQNEDGVIFRKDIPFPDDLQVMVMAKKKVNGRIFRQSELERKVEEVNGKESVTVDLQRKGTTVLYTIKDSTFSIPNIGDEEEAKAETSVQNPFRQAPPPDKTMTFIGQGSNWKGKKSTDFKMMAMNQKLSPVFGDLMIDNAILPRNLWFSANRIKVGDEIAVSSALLPMIIPGNAKGSLTIKLMEIGDIEGHPCAMFSVTGQYNRKGYPSLEGHLIDQDVSVESGELWLSLLYPIILKEKLKTIQTFSPSESGSVVGRAQGTVDTLIVREWKADLPDPALKPEPPAPAPDLESETESEPEPAPASEPAPAE